MVDEEAGDAESALAITREEARDTLERQLDTLDDIDTKAAKILRLNVVVVGALLTVVSITVDADVGLSPLYNQYTLAGAVSLLCSTVFAAMTYTVSDVSAGLSDSDVRNAVEGDYARDELLEGLALAYADWIDANYRENVGNTPLITATILLLVYALTGFFLGVAEAFAGPVPISVVATLLVLLATVTWVTKIHAQIRRWWQVR